MDSPLSIRHVFFSSSNSALVLEIFRKLQAHTLLFANSRINYEIENKLYGAQWVYRVDASDVGLGSKRSWWTLLSHPNIQGGEKS